MIFIVTIIGAIIGVSVMGLNTHRRTPAARHRWLFGYLLTCAMHGLILGNSLAYHISHHRFP